MSLIDILKEKYNVNWTYEYSTQYWVDEILADLEELRPYVENYNKIVEICNNRNDLTTSLCFSAIKEIVNENLQQM